jgi:hypothetical protein
MEILTAEQFDELCSKADVLQKDASGVKVVRRADGQMVKIFRRKHLLSSAWFRPYARRFQQNAERLAALGVSTVRVNKLSRCPSRARHLAFYDPLAGTGLRDYLAENAEHCRILEEFASFLAELHAKGIYFRSIHFGNVIVLPGQAGFGLIDVADLFFCSAPLSFRLRLRNCRHFLRYREDRKSLENFGLDRFTGIYGRKAGLSVEQRNKLRNRIRSELNR